MDEGCLKSILTQKAYFTIQMKAALKGIVVFLGATVALWVITLILVAAETAADGEWQVTVTVFSLALATSLAAALFGVLLTAAAGITTAMKPKRDPLLFSLMRYEWNEEGLRQEDGNGTRRFFRWGELQNATSTKEFVVVKAAKEGKLMYLPRPGGNEVAALARSKK
ncbi:MAG: hypothetical protein LBM78_03350 [Clostridiales bacterium]|jgi:hypothetical protein|nr:hypothetical protein [Clostridiales bacterium]